jgi:hypothetical protein
MSSEELQIANEVNKEINKILSLLNQQEIHQLITRISENFRAENNENAEEDKMFKLYNKIITKCGKLFTNYNGYCYPIAEYEFIRQSDFFGKRIKTVKDYIISKCKEQLSRYKMKKCDGIIQRAINLGYEKHSGFTVIELDALPLTSVYKQIEYFLINSWIRKKYQLHVEITHDNFFKNFMVDIFDIKNEKYISDIAYLLYSTPSIPDSCIKYAIEVLKIPHDTIEECMEKGLEFIFTLILNHVYKIQGD